MRSQNYRIWISVDDPRRCSACEEKKGQVYAVHSERVSFFTKLDGPPLHVRCRCKNPMDRILYSNDGLIFVTYDHYKTFVEII